MLCTTQIKMNSQGPVGDPFCIDSDTSSETFGTVVDCALCTSCDNEPQEQLQCKDIKVCFDDCTEGFTLIQIDLVEGVPSITSLGVFNMDGTPAIGKTIVPCQPTQTVEQELCVTE